MDWLPSNDICHRLSNLFGDVTLTEGMLNENVVSFDRGVVKYRNTFLGSDTLLLGESFKGATLWTCSRSVRLG